LIRQESNFLVKGVLINRMFGEMFQELNMVGLIKIKESDVARIMNSGECVPTHQIGMQINRIFWEREYLDLATKTSH